MSKPHPIYLLAEEESATAAAKLLAMPDAGALFGDYLRAQATMETYKTVPAPEVSSSALEAFRTNNPNKFLIRPAPRPSEASQVVEGAVKHLQAVNQRQTSREIALALINDGIAIGGPDLTAHVSRVSAHLSASTKFNNDRVNGGYGLSSWRMGQKMGPITHK